MPSHTFVTQTSLFINSAIAAVSNDSFVYACVGRATAWDSELAPPVVNNTITTIRDMWRNMIFAKRVDDTCLVTQRITWTSNTVYTYYDDTADLANTNFYVVDDTSEPYRVYKCLWNNGGANSTIAPSINGSVVTPQLLADGYVWQYLYTISDDYRKFLTSTWMPVLTDNTVVASAVSRVGELVTLVPIIINDGGAGYATASNVVVTILGDGAGANVYANAISIVSGAITSMYLTDGGSNYSFITGVNVYQNTATSFANTRIIIPPYPNHGHNPVIELGNIGLMCVVNLSSESNTFSTNLSYRQISVVATPNDASGVLAEDMSYRQSYRLSFTANTGTFAIGDTIINTSGNTLPEGIVAAVYTANTTQYLELVQIQPHGATVLFSNSDIITNNTYTAVIDTVDEPGLSQFSGDVIYISNVSPIERTLEQTEQLKFVFPIG